MGELHFLEYIALVVKVKNTWKNKMILRQSKTLISL